MTVGVVNSYQYSSSVQYQYFGTTVSEDRLKQLMDKYGIQPTGDSDKDLEALYSVMYSNAKTEVTDSAKISQNFEASANSLNTVPWANLMVQVGLSVTGDLTTDKANFDAKISQMQAGASSLDQQANVSLLQAEASTVFVQQSQSNQGASSQAQVSGFDIMAQLNKMYLFGG